MWIILRYSSFSTSCSLRMFLWWSTCNKNNEDFFNMAGVDYKYLSEMFPDAKKMSSW